MNALNARNALNALGRTAVVGVLVAGASLPMVRAGADQPAPFADPNAKGFVALCDQRGNAVTGGRVDARPFVWKAVSSSTPPSGYLGKGENAVLTVYQARDGVDPGNWNGDQLTGASYFTNPKLPTAQATYADLSLAVIVREFPPTWDGLYQLRMAFAKTDYGNYSATYPATVIKVSGNSWHVVSGGTLPCGAAHSVSNESFLGIGKKPLPATRGASDGAVTSGTGGATPGTPQASVVTSGRHRSTGRFGAGYLVLAVVGGLAAATAAGWLLWRRRTFPSLTTLGAADDNRDAVIPGRTYVR